MNISTGKHYLQAIVDIGSLDTYVAEIKPLHHQIKVLGATSDHVMLDLENHDHYQVEIKFNLVSVIKHWLIVCICLI
ncbi:amino acid racemase [Staphylococcus gallinarum]|uniref:Amino acid racemase n=1 Tax=Staphylococcus gallinarum TaxID=1293 RepID=A0A380FLZ9_STAGA|nr:amino acid racemase [Staphylococcus gallinarum]